MPKTISSRGKGRRRADALAQLLLLLAPACSFAATAAPSAGQLLDAALRPSATAYRGKMIVARWYGRRSRAEEVEVSYSPPNKYRWEFLAPDGRPDRVVIGDGKNEWIQLPHERRLLRGSAIKSAPKRISPEAELALLFKNYDAALKGEKRVAGRPTWLLELTPKAPRKNHELIWIDQRTGVVLETKKFLPERPFASLSRFADFEPSKSLPDSLFQPETGPDVVVDDHGLDPGFLSLAELNAVSGKSLRFPGELPEGFVFENADLLTVGGTTVRCARYTDGLTVLSLYQTDRPVRLSGTEPVQDASPADLPGSLRFSSAGKVLTWKSREGRYFTLIGDVSQELLRTASERLK